MSPYAYNIYLIILNWNGKEDTLECLSSVQKIDYFNLTIIVADNGSTDDSTTAIRAAFPDVILLENNKNLGFAEGNNVGISYALSHGADYILLLNNDTVVDADILNEFLYAAQEKQNQGIFGAKIFYYNQPSVLWYAGGYWDHQKLSFYHDGIGEEDSISYSALKTCDYVCGCALFIPALVIKKIGLMDSSFFLTYEETDWCYRARKAGFPSYFVPKAKLWHKISISFGGENSPLQSYFYMRNILLWGIKHLSTLIFLKLLQKKFFELIEWQNIPSFSIKLVYWNIARAIKLISNSTDPIFQAKKDGFSDFIFHRFGDCPEKIRILNKNAK